MRFDQRRAASRDREPAAGSPPGPAYDYPPPSVSWGLSSVHPGSASPTPTPSLASGVTGARPVSGDRRHFTFAPKA
jgi:hypothetical protein